jgi:SAM-dependent methyltransferase
MTDQNPHAILRCPIGHCPVRPLREEETAGLNAAISRGDLQHADGSPATTPIAGGFAARKGPYVYPVIDGIVIMLPARALVAGASAGLSARLSLPNVSSAYPAIPLHVDPAMRLRNEKQGMQQFYDDVGWTKPGEQDFVDAQKWEDLRPVARDYIDRCHRRVGRHLPSHGDYFLDVACGPVQYPQYVDYSKGYRRRICMDLSFVALREARRKLGEHGVYILGDITNLPLADGAIDGGVSLHTIYHVPADEQHRAFEELSRVLRPGATAAVVYSWAPYSPLLKLVQFPAKLARAPWRLVSKLFGRAKKSRGGRNTPYFHAHSFRWFTSRTWPFDYQIHSWRSIPVPLLRSYAHRWLVGRWLLAGLFRIEDRFPRFFGRRGAYPLILIHKPESKASIQTTSATRRAA